MTNYDKSRFSAQERLRHSLLMGKFAGPIMQPAIQAEMRGIRDSAAGLAYTANPYDDPIMRWHWVEGFSTANNMKWPTYKGSAPRMNKPPSGHIV